MTDAGARWYDPAIGRFMQADSIVPDPQNPQSLNRYSYVLNNPLKYTDPTGMIAENEQEEAESIIDRLYTMYGILISADWYYWEGSFIEGLWSLSEMQDIGIALGDISSKYSSIDAFKFATGKVYVTKTSNSFSEGRGNSGDLLLCGGFSWYKHLQRKVLFTHELFHIIDWRSGNNPKDRYSGKMVYHSGVSDSSPVNADGSGKEDDEDYVDSATGFVYPEWANSLARNRLAVLQVAGAGVQYRYQGSPRWNYVQSTFR